ncbi:putative H4MPT-linked C1 transfer pathway protein [Methylohalomonas lacus]|uniref:H4MPT-linked C1 transfer pathway protein n=1 Tax=Methylohalomonas lacus TaxID=398773 RepID=A0AAE3HP77_9GAMM|nr:hydantoinase/oxoprolinase family protein [Methylohalomonas lacus]MCS3904472.1 putative H4MPT-linked C1 transfer pathway protein [Methylohalomonas lacus]
MTHHIGWDIGGAHLKMVALDDRGRVVRLQQLPAPLWQGLDTLVQAFTTALETLPADSREHAVTMTGELADCFPDRASGVCALVDAAVERLGTDIRIYSTAGLLEPAAARVQPAGVASANWHASAAWLGRYYQDALLLDIGSTTTDIIPIRAGQPASRGYTDRQRMQYDELVYSGVVRTPVMAVAQYAPVAGVDQHLAAETFAVMADVYRLLEQLPADADQHPTADGGDQSVAASARRLARMAGTDMQDCDMSVWLELADHLGQRQTDVLVRALERVAIAAGLDAQAPLVGAGCGRFLVRTIACITERPYHDALETMNDRLDQQHQTTDMLPAFALADGLCKHADVT